MHRVIIQQSICAFIEFPSSLLLVAVHITRKLLAKETVFKCFISEGMILIILVSE